jgi:iron complex outermembrane recepter protein
MLHSTWTLSARPPSLGDLNDSHNQAAIVSLADPTVPRGITEALILEGGDPSVTDERSVSWTNAVEFAPDSAPGLSLSATYFQTLFENGLEQPVFGGNLLSNPYYAPIVTRNPTATQIVNVCSRATFPQGTTAQCETLPVGAIVDLRLRNLSRIQTSGLDFSQAYRHQVGHGELDIALDGTWILQYAQAQTPTQPLYSSLDTQNNPIDLRLRGSLGWRYGRFRTVSAVNFTNGYRDTASVPQRRVRSWTTVDMKLIYDMPGGESGSWLDQTRVQLDAQNVFNIDPPFLNNQVMGIGYDQENANPYGRILRLTLVKRW